MSDAMEQLKAMTGGKAAQSCLACGGLWSDGSDPIPGSEWRDDEGDYVLCTYCGYWMWEIGRTVHHLTRAQRAALINATDADALRMAHDDVVRGLWG